MDEERSDSGMEYAQPGSSEETGDIPIEEYEPTDEEEYDEEPNDDFEAIRLRNEHAQSLTRFRLRHNLPQWLRGIRLDNMKVLMEQPDAEPEAMSLLHVVSVENARSPYDVASILNAPLGEELALGSAYLANLPRMADNDKAAIRGLQEFGMHAVDQAIEQKDLHRYQKRLFEQQTIDYQFLKTLWQKKTQECKSKQNLVALQAAEIERLKGEVEELKNPKKRKAISTIIKIRGVVVSKKLRKPDK